LFNPVRHFAHGIYGEPHYRPSELQSLGVFDIALTAELNCNGEQELIVTQRFYQFCLKQKIALEVEPVRIDPD